MRDEKTVNRCLDRGNEHFSLEHEDENIQETSENGTLNFTQVSLKFKTTINDLICI